MDAVPVTLGQEFGGYAAQVRLGVQRVEATLRRVGQIPLGGTATGTGLNTHPEFAAKVREKLAADTGLAISAPARPLRGAGQPRRAGRALGRAQGLRRLAQQDRQRPGADGLRPPRRPRRAAPAGAAEGLLDHARQGQPGDPGGRDPGRRPGDRQRRRDHRRRQPGPVRAQRAGAADRPQPARLDQAARLRLAPAEREMRRRARGQRGDDRRATPRRPWRRRPRSTPTSATTAPPTSSRPRPSQAARCARSRWSRASSPRCSRRRWTTAAWPGRTSRPHAFPTFLAPCGARKGGNDQSARVVDQQLDVAVFGLAFAERARRTGGR